MTLPRRTVLGAALAAAGSSLLPRSAEGGAHPGALPAATVRARRRFFGAANVRPDGRPRPDRVMLSWFGVGGFALAMGGEVLLIDAWVPRGEYSGYVPTDPDELAALRPRHVLIGHGHFDHAADAPYIAERSGAVVVGTPEQCAQVTRQSGGRARVRPVGATDAAAGSLARFALPGGIRAEAVRHLHSTAEPPGGTAPVLLPPDLSPVLRHPPSLRDSLHEISHLPDEEGGSLLYRLRLGTFSLVWHDTSGPIGDAPRVLQALRGLRRPTVQVGAVQGFGQYTNGLRDPMQYVAALRPRVFVPCHHDNWAPPITSNGSSWERPLRSALSGMGADAPRLVMLRDPEDYVRPGRLTFRI